MQSSSSTRPFKPTLAGASPATDAILILDFRFAIFDFEQAASSSTDRKSKFKIQKSLRSQGVISSARRSAKAEVRGANPRESASLGNPKAEGRRPKSESRTRQSKTLPTWHFRTVLRPSDFGLISQYLQLFRSAPGGAELLMCSRIFGTYMVL